MNRHFFVSVHRYVGLAIAPFLIVVGLTGSVIAFYSELNGWLNPPQPVAADGRALLDPFVLHDRAEALEPYGRSDWIVLGMQGGEAYGVELSPKTDPSTGKPFDLPFNTLYLNPYTGVLLGKQATGASPFTRQGILPFLYDLHMFLALPERWNQFGALALGIIAVAWTIDCFVGFYLTLPKRLTKPYFKNANNSARHSGNPCRNDDFLIESAYKRNSFWQRWKPAWLIKRRRLNYDLHRASGLWLWPMLLVFSWSGVAFNLHDEVYLPVMTTLFKFGETPPELPARTETDAPPKLRWRRAISIGRTLMAEQAARRGFTITREEALWLDREYWAYHYDVSTNHDLAVCTKSASVIFDADTGALISVKPEANLSTGDIITQWLCALHMARVGGLPYKLFVCFIGLGIAILSVTGIYIWYKKHQAARLKRKMSKYQGIVT